MYLGGHVKYSPYTIDVEAASACAGRSSVVSAPAGTAVAGYEQELQVATRDEFGNPTRGGADSVVVLVENHLGGTTTIPTKDTQAGTYGAQLAMPSQAGLLTYTVMVNGAPVETTPATIQVRTIKPPPLLPPIRHPDLGYQLFSRLFNKNQQN
eukprot:1487462-Pyramimonas_sp.AAC.1